MKQRLIRICLVTTFIITPAFGQTLPALRAPGAAQAGVPSASDNTPEGISTSTKRSEDWSTLSIQKSGLPLSAIGGVVLSKIEGPGFTRELVRVEWRRGDPIELYVIRPHGVAKPPVILYLYNYTAEGDRFRDDGWCRRATKEGFAAVGFDSALAGQRFHAPRPMKEWFVSELQEALATSTHDVQMVLNYLAARGDINMQKVGMFGQESGGAIALLAASVDPRIGALDVFNPWGDWPDWLKDSRQIPDSERSQYLDPAFLEKVSNLDPISVLSSIPAKSVRIQEVMDDPITPASAQTKMIAAAPKRTDVVRFDTAADHEKAYRVDGLSGWLKSQLETR